MFLDPYIIQSIRYNNFNTLKYFIILNRIYLWHARPIPHLILNHANMKLFYNVKPFLHIVNPHKI